MGRVGLLAAGAEGASGRRCLLIRNESVAVGLELVSEQVSGRCRLAGSCPELLEARSEEVALDSVLGEQERLPVGRSRFGGAAEAAQKACAYLFPHAYF